MPVAKGTPYIASLQHVFVTFREAFLITKVIKRLQSIFFKGKRVTKIIQTYKIKAPLFAELRFTQ